MNEDQGTTQPLVGAGHAHPGMPCWAAVAMLAVAAWFVVTHLVHVFTEAVNWDEFALLARADRTARFGEVVGGGRPGLVSVLLIPFVLDCVDSVRSVVNARVLWQFITLAYLAGVYALVRRWFARCNRPTDGRVQGLLAVALLAFLPAFVTWSVQVRTDQVALATATWGGVALLSAGLPSAALAGLLFCVAMLATQKALYVIALCVLLFAAAGVARGFAAPDALRAELRAGLLRVAVVACVAAAAAAIYLYFVPQAARLASGAGVGSGLEVMDWVRKRQGYRSYTVHADRLVVHWVLFAILVAWTVRTALRRDRAEWLVVATGWLVLALGLMVVRFHGSSFPYFLMTAGLFPALGLSLAAGGPLRLAGRLEWPVVVSLVALAAAQSAWEALEMTVDSQSTQRETMRLIRDSGLRERRGYSVEGAAFCARDPDPMPTMFSQGIWQKFRDNPPAVAAFIQEFRDRPIAYIVESYRMNQFPSEIRTFFGEHYVWHEQGLLVAGVDIRGPGDIEADIIVDGEYRWVPGPQDPNAWLQVDSVSVRPLATVQLPVGRHEIVAGEGSAGGKLILADLPPPRHDAYQAFYNSRQIIQLGGRR
jgi:hypothetical protein